MELFVSELGGDVKQKILDKMNAEYLSTGKFVKDQMSVSPRIMSSLMLSGGVAGTASSSAMSSKMYMTFADPSKLMKFGNAYGGTIMEAGKFAGQAKFLPVASSIPVVAPVMAIQALTSVAMMQQFSAMDKKLDAIKGSIDKMLARQEVTKIAELLAAVNIVDEIYMQYNQNGCFSTDMLVRLALAERDAMILSKRYEILENSETPDINTNNFANYDTYCTMLASFLNLRVKYLRTCVDIQENPQFVQCSSKNFSSLLKDNIVLWDKLLRKSDKIKSDIEKHSARLEKASALQKITKRSEEKELARKKDEYTIVMEKERVILKDFHSLIDIANSMSNAANEQPIPTLIYWHDEEGEHCIATCTGEQILNAA